jgi:hypothetical protein
VVESAFAWRPSPEAARFVEARLEAMRRRSPALERLARRMHDETGTRLVDWIDHLALPATEASEASLEALGFEARARGAHPSPSWVHPSALLPPIALGGASRSRGGVDSNEGELRVVIGVESVTDFLLAHGAIADARVEGSPGGPLRRARLGREGGVELWVVERHGASGFEPFEVSAASRTAAAQHFEALLTRPRAAGDDLDATGSSRSGGASAPLEAAFDECLARVRDAQATLGEGLALALFFRAERAYWQSRSRAARVQKARQDALGLGWANHDHHTYRSSRRCFHRVIELMEALGLAARERFYAGAEAGWGAQVLEHPTQRIVVFADVDLSPEEVTNDFAHAPLAPREGYGTVGLWCALHGESALEAGMHHLECRFDFDAARAQLERAGVPSMAPFTDLPTLRQAFTVAERWAVAPWRLEALRASGALSAEEAARLERDGALGSHLEVLERRDGYRGFNPRGISAILRRTDPRRADAAPG